MMGIRSTIVIAYDNSYSIDYSCLSADYVRLNRYSSVEPTVKGYDQRYNRLRNSNNTNSICNCCFSIIPLHLSGGRGEQGSRSLSERP